MNYKFIIIYIILPIITKAKNNNYTSYNLKSVKF